MQQICNISWYSEKYMVKLCLELTIEIHPATKHGWHTDIEDFWMLTNVDRDYLLNTLSRWLYSGTNKQQLEDGHEMIATCNFINIGKRNLRIRAKRV